LTTTSFLKISLKLQRPFRSSRGCREITITLRPKYPFKVPVYADCISPDIFAGKSCDEIAGLKVWEGNRQRSLGDVFDINGEGADPTEKLAIHLTGDLRKVRMIGCKMTSGTIVAEGNIGMRLGEGMKGGEVLVKGNVESWAGCMMKGGRIEVTGSAGDYVGASYRGSTEGMMDGVILIHGDAGNEAGCYMKGGLIKIEENVGEFVGVHMRDGTIMVQGDCKGRPGAGMFDGRIIICGHVSSVVPTFTIDSVRPDVKVDGEKITGPFYRFVGDIAEEGKGKLFIAKSKNPHLAVHEKYL
jgi:formylmethanofuran dehydrogenase subunit C